VRACKAQVVQMLTVVLRGVTDRYHQPGSKASNLWGISPALGLTCFQSISR